MCWCNDLTKNFLLLLCSQLLLVVFREEASKAKEVAEKKRKDREATEKRRQEILKKKREQEELESGDAAIREVTDEEADRLQKEIDEAKWVWVGPISNIVIVIVDCFFIGKVKSFRQHLQLNRKMKLLTTMKRIPKKKANWSRMLEMAAI